MGCPSGHPRRYVPRYVTCDQRHTLRLDTNPGYPHNGYMSGYEDYDMDYYYEMDDIADARAEAMSDAAYDEIRGDMFNRVASDTVRCIDEGISLDGTLRRVVSWYEDDYSDIVADIVEEVYAQYTE